MAEPVVQVVHLNVSSQKGGAAVAMQSLNMALASHGIRSVVLAREGEEDPGVSFWPDPFLAARKELQRRFIWSDRTALSNSEFSLDALGVDFSRCKALSDADIIHLHWVAGYLSSKSLIQLADFGKPVVWTLHDIQPLAGGCHFPAGCHRWEVGCRDCPQLQRDPHDLARLQAAAQKRALEILQPTFVAPSRWMGDLAGRSECATGLPVVHVPYGVDTKMFQPADRLASRRRLGLPERDLLVLLSCQSFREQRKGFEEAIQIWKQLETLQAADEARSSRIRLVLCGELPVELALRFPPDVISLGFVEERGKMVDAYNAADLLLFTSLEDNLPNVLLEAGSCGLPACAFPVGGVADIVADGETGIHLDRADSTGSARMVIALLRDPARLREMGRCARERMLSGFSIEGQAVRMANLYRSLLAGGPRPRPLGVSPPLEGASVVLHALLNGQVPPQAVEEGLWKFLDREVRLILRRMRRVGRLQVLPKRSGALSEIVLRSATALQQRVYRFETHEPKTLHYPSLPVPKSSGLPRIAIVTPAFNGQRFLEATIDSIVNQGYPNLDYVVQDGGSTDGTQEILSRRAVDGVLAFSEKDSGQANAINKGFAKTTGEIMAWVNADDMLVPGCLSFVGDFFARNPDVDVLYGHRIVVNTEGQEVGRWWSPAWRAESIEFYDYIAQETLFWRRSLWNRLQPAGVDERFHFAMDWDLLARMKDEGARVVRVPFFLGIFRVHDTQKTACLMDSVGRREMTAIRSRYRSLAAWNKQVPFRMMKDLCAVLATQCLWKAGFR